MKPLACGKPCGRKFPMKFPALIVAALFTMACDYNYDFHAPNAPTTAKPTTPAAAADVIEFRVTGDLPLVIVRVDNGLDGLTQTTTVLPYTSQISLKGFDQVFLSVDARGTGTGFLHVAIFINGVIFREASSIGTNPIAAVSGTYRRAR